MPSAKVAPEPDLVEGSGRYPVEPEASASRGKRTSATAWHDAVRRGLGGPTIGAVDHGGERRRRPRGDASPLVDARAGRARGVEPRHAQRPGGRRRARREDEDVGPHEERQEGDARRAEADGGSASIIHVRVVHHLADHTERAVLLECVDGVYLTQLTKMVQEALKQPKVRLLWLTAEGETIVLDSQRVFDQFAGEEWCVQPWVLHVPRGLSEGDPRVGAARRVARALRAVRTRARQFAKSHFVECLPCVKPTASAVPSQLSSSTRISGSARTSRELLHLLDVVRRTPRSTRAVSLKDDDRARDRRRSEMDAADRLEWSWKLSTQRRAARSAFGCNSS